MATETKEPKGYADEIPIYCEYTEIVPTESLRPNPKNPNKHPLGQITLLAKLIRSHGWRSPITVSTRSGLIVRGEGRYLAAVQDGLKEIPVDYQTYDSEEMELADLLADNEVARRSQTDSDALVELLGMIDEAGLDLQLTGFSEAELSILLNPEGAGDPSDLLDGGAETAEDLSEEEISALTGDKVSWVLLLSFSAKDDAEAFLEEHGLPGKFKRNARTLHVSMCEGGPD